MNTSKTSLFITAVVIVGAVVLFLNGKKDTVVTPPTTTDSTQQTVLPGLQTGDAPWIAEIDHLKDRLSALGLPALTQEGMALHTHQHLDISIHGVAVQVPANIGINNASRFISQIHVHDLTNVIHVESPTIETFTLGQFFDIWGVRFSEQCIGGYCTDATNALSVYINGTLYSGDPRAIELTAHQELFVFYGIPAELPKTIPSSYQFQAGE